MQNEPNFTTNAPTNHANDADFTPNFSSEIPKKMQNIPKKSKIIKKNALCKFQSLIHITPYTTKTYITFYPKTPLTGGLYPPSLWPEKMQNEPNFIQSPRAGTHLLIHPFTHQHNHAKRTQFHTSTNPPIHPFIQNEPNSTSERRAEFTRLSCGGNNAKRTQFHSIHPSTHLLIHPNMQNEPNLHANRHKCFIHKDLRKRIPRKQD